MAFVIGNFSDSLYPQSVKTALANDNSPVYGVKWDARWTNVQRLYDAQDKIVELSTPTKKGRDDFENLPPFNVKECITQYNESTKKREVLAYKGDADWDTLVVTKTGDRMIEFPCFWYKRVGIAHILISPTAKEGFKPSAAHLRGGILYDKVRISKYLIDVATASSINTALGNSVPISKQGIDDMIGKVRAKGAYLLDVHCWNMLLLLSMVKHAQYTFSSYLNLTAQWSTNYVRGDVGDSILGLDGYDQGQAVLFGLENPYYFSTNYIDGLYLGGTGYTIYYKDILTISEYPSNIRVDCTKLSDTYTLDSGWTDPVSTYLTDLDLGTDYFIPTTVKNTLYANPEKMPGRATSVSGSLWAMPGMYAPVLNRDFMFPMYVRFFEFE